MMHGPQSIELTHEDDLANMSIRADDYTSGEQIRVSIGQGLRILHIGLAYLSSPQINCILPSLSHVPEIPINLG